MADGMNFPVSLVLIFLTTAFFLGWLSHTERKEDSEEILKNECELRSSVGKNEDDDDFCKHNSIMTDHNKSTIIVFHSYPKKPCIDGLFSAIITSALYKDSNIVFVPYWRTDECFQRVRKAIETKMAAVKTKVVYVDCAPDLPQEVAYLASILKKVDVEVFDHHPRKEDSPINELIGKDNFTFTFDADNCAAKMMYKHLSEIQKKELNIEEVLQIVQYSEYEGMNPKVAGLEQATKIAAMAFHKAVQRTSAGSEAAKYLQEISKIKMQLFFVLDNILAEAKHWSFLYDESLTYQDTCQQFVKESLVYREHCKDVISGCDNAVFSEKETQKYLSLLEELKKKIAKGKVINNREIGGIHVNVFCAALDIFTYGRSLEPYIREEMKVSGASYAILMNSPTENNKGELSYYFSLRRLNEDYDARKLAKFVMDISGSTIGGGHPWASGVTLNEKQYKQFMKAMNLGN